MPNWPIRAFRNFVRVLHGPPWKLMEPECSVYCGPVRAQKIRYIVM